MKIHFYETDNNLFPEHERRVISIAKGRRANTKLQHEHVCAFKPWWATYESNITWSEALLNCWNQSVSCSKCVCVCVCCLQRWIQDSLELLSCCSAACSISSKAQWNNQSHFSIHEKHWRRKRQTPPSPVWPVEMFKNVLQRKISVEPDQAVATSS